MLEYARQQLCPPAIMFLSLHPIPWPPKSLASFSVHLFAYKRLTVQPICHDLNTIFAQCKSVDPCWGGANAGRPVPVKKRGAVKPRKKETAVTTKKGAKGNTRAALPTSSPTAPREVVGEGGLPAGEGQREEPAASSAGQATPAAGAAAKEGAEAAAREAAGAVETNLPTSVAPQQGVCPWIDASGVGIFCFG